MKRRFTALAMLLSLAVIPLAARAQTADTPPVPKQPLELLPAEYPLASLLNNEEGTVGLNLIVNSDGQVTFAQVNGPSGFPRLDAALLNVVKTRWQFQPATSNGTPVAGQFIANAVIKAPLEPAYEFLLPSDVVPSAGATINLTPPMPISQQGLQIGVDPAVVRTISTQYAAVKYLVLEDGTIGETEIIRSSGYPTMDREIIREMKIKWKFHAAMLNGKATKFWLYKRLLIKFFDRRTRPQVVSDDFLSHICTSQPVLGGLVTLNQDGSEDIAQIGERIHVAANGSVDDVILETRKGWMRFDKPLLAEFASHAHYPPAVEAKRPESCWLDNNLTINQR